MGKNKKIFLLSAFAVILLLLISIYLVFFQQNNSQNKTIVLPEKSEQEKLLEQNSQALQIAKNAENTLVRGIDSSDHVLGETSAPVHLIVYDDFDNIFSVAYFQILEKARQEYGEKLVIALRPFPMRSHASSLTAALAADCAGEQGKFWEMAKELYAIASSTGINQEAIDGIATSLSLKTADFSNCIKDQKTLDKIQALIFEAGRFNVTGAPTTFINRIPYPGAYQYEDFTDSAGQKRKGIKSIIDSVLTE